MFWELIYRNTYLPDIQPQIQYKFRMRAAHSLSCITAIPATNIDCLPATNRLAVALCSPCLSVLPQLIFVLLFCSEAVTLIVLLTSGGTLMSMNVNPLCRKEPPFPPFL